MDKNEGFKVEISSDYDEFWRFNVLVTCACFDGEGKQIDFVSVDDAIAPVRSNLKSRPLDCPATRTVVFETEPCSRIFMYIYLIPHTMIASRYVDDDCHYAVVVRITRAGQVVAKSRFMANKWTGASIEMGSTRKYLRME